MNKTQLDLCREIVGLFNKASFTVVGVELLQHASKITMFAKMITDEEAKNSEDLKKSDTVVPEIKTINAIAKKK